MPDEPAWRLALGESVAVSGVCLTVVEAGPGRLAFDLAEETLRVTTLGGLGAGDPVNLERPLRFDGRLGGHLVLGHVDGMGRVTGVRPEGEGARLDVEVPRRPPAAPDPEGLGHGRRREPHGGGPRGERLRRRADPHTLAVTTLGRRRGGRSG